MIILDSSYLIALITNNLKNHELAKRIEEKIKKEKKVINITIYTEVLNKLQKSYYNNTRDEIIDLLNEFEILYLTPEDYKASLEIYKYHYGYSVNYNDCTILKSMQDHGITTIATFDSDFEKVANLNVVNNAS